MGNVKQLQNSIENGQYDGIFSELYSADGEKIKAQRVRYTDALEGFAQRYGAERDVAVYSAPGRTEIGGNHTDHNHGLVMAAAVNLDIICVAGKTGNGTIRLQSKGFSREDMVDLGRLSPVAGEEGISTALIRGVAAGIAQRGGAVGGLDCYTTSDVLRGSGLSSSAAFEVCVANVLSGEFNDGRFSAVDIGIIGQYAENVFFGKPSGLLDQTSCSVGGAVTVDFKDPTAPVVEAIPFDLRAFGLNLVITDTKGSHANLTHEYAAIPTEMKAVAAHFGKNVLRDVPRETFFADIPSARKAAGDRAVLRAIHFYEECRRVPLLANAIKTGNMREFLNLIRIGGNSSFAYNQNAYCIAEPKSQSIPVGLALSETLLMANGGAWRLQGGGFAGTIQAFVPDAELATYCAALENVFGAGACHVLNIRAKGGTRVMS